MIGLDTNVLVRYITQDDREQAARASRLIATLDPEAPAFVGTATILELVWVLASFYGFGDEEISLAIESLLASSHFALEHPGDVFAAMIALRNGADFADALITATADRVGCSYTLTFDRKALRLHGFRTVP